MCDANCWKEGSERVRKVRMGNAESSTYGGKLQEEEEEGEASLVSMLIAGTIAAAGFAMMAAARRAASRYLQSSPPLASSLEGEEELVVESTTSSSSSQSLELDGDYVVDHRPPQRYRLRDNLPEAFGTLQRMCSWHSIDTDFSAPRGIGYVISDDNGNVVLAGARSVSLDNKKCTQGEAMAVQFALQRASELKRVNIIIRKVKLKCDNESLVKCINGLARTRRKMKASIQSFVKAGENFQDYEVLHVSRDQIQAANFLARCARNHDDLECEWYLGTSSSGRPAPRELTEFLLANGLRWPNA